MKDRIERLKRELGCTQKDIADVFGVTAVMFSMYVSGRRKWPGWVLLRVSIMESSLCLDPVQNDVVFMASLESGLMQVARETIAGVERLKRLDAMRRRAL